MSQTSHINAIHLQIMAEEHAAADKANGSYKTNRSADSKYYLWQSEFMTCPSGMDGEPEQFAAKIAEALPTVNTLRMPFNEFSFDENGELHEQYGRFLEAAAKNGFQFIMVYAGGAAQGHNVDIDDPAEAEAFLQGRVLDGMTEGWTKMGAWMDAHPAVAGAVYANEIVNEPAMYKEGAGLVDDARFVELYAEHMIEVGRMISAGSDAKVMVGGFGYSGLFNELATGNVGGMTAIDAIRASFGEDLVWSAHLYPGWVPSEGDPDTLKQSLADHYAVLGDDDVVITETNASGSLIDNPGALGTDVATYAQAYEWFSDRGIGTGWFPGVETGGSNFVVIDGNGGLRFLHQGSLAHGMNLFSLGETPQEHAAGEEITTNLVRGRVRNERHDEDGLSFDDTDGIAYGFGYGGNDTISGQNRANDLIYGGDGNDRIYGVGNDDHLFGQDGNDVLRGGNGNDVLVGGRGDDTMSSGNGTDMMTGGDGADLFHASGAGNLHVVDFDHAEGDRFRIDNRTIEFATLVDTGTVIAAGDDGIADDLEITSGGNSYILHEFTRINAEAIEQMSQERESRAGAEDGQASETAAPEPAPAEPVEPEPDASEMRADPTGPVLGTRDAELIDGAYRDADGNHVSEGNDIVRAGNGADEIHTGAGDDKVNAGRGDDVVFGGAGNDKLNALRGADTLYGGAGNDFINLGHDNSTAYGGAGKDFLFSQAIKGGNQVVSGGDGVDRFEFRHRGVEREGSVRFTDFEAGVETLTIDGVDFASYVEGLADASDRARMVDSDLVFRVGETNELIFENADMDAFSKEFGITVENNAGDPEMTDANETRPVQASRTISGSDGDDTLHGGDGDDVINSGRGNDIVHGGNGDDEIYAGTGNDTVYAGSGNDHVHASAGRNLLMGEAGDDHLMSGYHSSELHGGEGDDTLELDISRGADHMASGGAGADTFIFRGESSKTSNVTINDFELRIDRLVLGGDFGREHVTRQQGDDMVFDFGNGDSLTLAGVHVDDWMAMA